MYGIYVYVRLILECVNCVCVRACVCVAEKSDFVKLITIFASGDEGVTKGQVESLTLENVLFLFFLNPSKILRYKFYDIS